MWTKRFWLLALVALNSIISTQSIEAQATPAKRDTSFRVVGYLQDYRVEGIDPSIGQHLTDLVFFSVKATPTGQFESKTLDDAKTKSSAQAVPQRAWCSDSSVRRRLGSIARVR